MKKYLWTLCLTAIAVLLTSVFEVFFFGGWLMLGFSVLAGVTAAWSGPEERLGRLFVSAIASGLIYGFIIMLWHEIWLASVSAKPFDFTELATYGLILGFCFLLGQLVGLAVRGAYSIKTKLVQ